MSRAGERQDIEESAEDRKQDTNWCIEGKELVRSSKGKGAKLRTFAETCIEKAKYDQSVAERGKSCTTVCTVKCSLTSSNFNKFVDIGCYK